MTIEETCEALLRSTYLRLRGLSEVVKTTFSFEVMQRIECRVSNYRKRTGMGVATFHCSYFLRAKSIEGSQCTVVYHVSFAVDGAHFDQYACRFA